MPKCDYNKKHPDVCEGDAKRRVIFEDLREDSPGIVMYLCQNCCEFHSEAIILDGGPVDPRDIPKKDRSPSLNRFIEKVKWEGVPDIGNCWPWNAYIDDNGYAQFWFSDREQMLGAHRFSFEWAYDMPAPPLESELEIAHSCNNNWCTNPMHLWLATRGENVQDSYNNGHGNRIADELAEELLIRHITEELSAYDLAEEYEGIEKTGIYNVVYCRSECYRPVYDRVLDQLAD